MSSADTVGVFVCRGCCCGTDKHPDVDHVRHLAMLHDALAPTHAVQVTDCLLSCATSNVVVVRPTALGRRHGARPVWLGHVVTDEQITALISWVDAGGPGASPTPPHLTRNMVSRPIRQRPNCGDPS